MSTKKYDVIADFIDEMTGKIVPAGSIFEADEPRAERAKEAKVLGDEVKKETSKSKNNDPKPSRDKASPVAPEVEIHDDQESDDQGEK